MARETRDAPQLKLHFTSLSSNPPQMTDKGGIYSLPCISLPQIRQRVLGATDG